MTTVQQSEWARQYQMAVAYDAGRNGTTIEQEIWLREMFVRMAQISRHHDITLDMIRERLNRKPEDRFYCPPDAPTV